MVRRPTPGFTLIELLICISIMVLLLLIGVPLGRTWAANAHIAQVESQLLQAYERTKALALRNPNGVTGANAAATLLINNTTHGLTVQDSASTTIWSGTMSSDVTAVLAGAACNNQLALDNNGLPLATALCTTAYTISASGGTNATGTLR